MSGDEAADLLIDQFNLLVRGTVDSCLSKIESGEVQGNPFTGQMFHQYEIVHKRLEEAELLEDPQFRAAFAWIINQVASGPLGSALVTLDGGARVDADIEYEVRIKGAETLPDVLHERFNPGESPAWPPDESEQSS